jgi:hypothetical protein
LYPNGSDILEIKNPLIPQKGFLKIVGEERI